MDISESERISDSVRYPSMAITLMNIPWSSSSRNITSSWDVKQRLYDSFMAFFRKEKEILRKRVKDGFVFILQFILLIMSMLFGNSVFKSAILRLCFQVSSAFAVRCPVAVIAE